MHGKHLKIMESGKRLSDSHKSVLMIHDTYTANTTTTTTTTILQYE